MSGDALLIGVDIGGTKVAAGLVDSRGKVSHRLVRATPRDGARAVLDVVCALAEELIGLAPPVAIGIGAPGVIDTLTGTVVSATDILPGWAGAKVAAELQERLGLQVTVENDVRVMGYGEAQCGAARGHTDALFVSLGTGVGGAWYRHGRLARGPHGTAGEIAHLLVGGLGPRACGCGRRDHLEAFAAGPAIAAAYAERTGAVGLSLQQVADRLRDGDREAAATVTGTAVILGRALAGLVAAVDTGIVVIGGGVAALGEALLGPLRDVLATELLPPLRGLPVVAASLGSDAAIVGAGLLASHRHASAISA